MTHPIAYNIHADILAALKLIAVQLPSFPLHVAIDRLHNLAITGKQEPKRVA
jgi:hypothetical protein